MFDRFTRLRPAARAVAAVLVVSSLVLAFFPFMAPGFYRSNGPWAPYHVVRTDRDPAEVAAILGDAGFDEVVWAGSTEVLVTRFSHLESVPLPRALEQLDPRDPRRDPYMEGLDAYFQDPEGQSLIYVESELPQRRVAALIRRSLGQDAEIVGQRAAKHPIGLAIYLVAAVLMVLLSRRRRISEGLCAATLVPAVFATGIPGGSAAAMVLITCSLVIPDVFAFLQERDRGEPFPRQAIWSAALAGGVVVFSVLSVGLIVGAGAGAAAGVQAATGFVPGIVSFLCGLAASMMMRGETAVHRDHDLFAPVSLFTGSVGRVSRLAWFRARPLIIAAAVIFFVVAAPLADYLLAPGPGGDVSDGRVDEGDYLAHRAFQESLAFGREWGLPAEGETVSLSRFRETAEGAYEQFSEVVLTFDNEWFAEALASPPAGVSRMLVTVAGGSGVVPDHEAGLYSWYPQIVIHTAYVLLALVPPVLIGQSVPRLSRRRSRVIEIVRRRKQVA